MLALTVVTAVGVWGGVRWNEAVKLSSGYFDERPAHAVTLTKPFYMGKFVVTQEQYQVVMGLNPSHFKGRDFPAELVSWHDTQEFCRKLSESMKQTARLPTEAEWEYACRAGTTTAYYSGDAEVSLERVAWYGENSQNTTHSVGQKEPNKFGLYDMHGNVYQWCQDWHGSDYYKKSAAENPTGPVQGAERSLRGGSWNEIPHCCRSAYRYWYGPEYRTALFGFRIVVELPVKKP